MLITAKNLRQVVRAFKKNPNESPEILQARLAIVIATVDSDQFAAMPFDQLLTHLKVLFELLDVHRRLPKELAKKLWRLYMLYQGYKCLQRKEVTS